MRSSSFPRVFFTGLCALSTVVAMSGCNSTSQNVDAGPMGVPAQPSSIPAERLVGKWGVAAYHRDSDRPRTEGEARRQCSNPYTITRGPNGGVMMHLADQAQPQELVLKGAGGGATYLGPAGRAGIDVDREIVAISDNSFTVKWVSPDNSSRYGTMVYIRCP
jgi:hypothetical protein